MSVAALELEDKGAFEQHRMSNSVLNAQPIDEFKDVFREMQEARKKLTEIVLSQATNNYHEIIEHSTEVIEATLKEMSDDRSLGQVRNIFSGGSIFSINIQDELRGLTKDVEFLKRMVACPDEMKLSEKLGSIDLPSILAPYHPISSQAFYEEMHNCERFLQKFVDSKNVTGVKPLFVTDWDGTMKDYCSQYATNVQPIYSALVMGTFASKYTRVSAVLTAGPLRGPGILDLTALPINGPVMFSGSWGREWWLGGRRVVRGDGIPEEGIVAIGELYEQLREMQCGEFVQFVLVGSGMQRKVDRLTLGVQTVFGHIPEDLTKSYIQAVKERIHRVDPNNQFLVLEETSPLEIEVCVHSSGTIWNKGDGVLALFEALNDSLSVGQVLVAGDTLSDLPMLQRAAEQNPEGVMALFIDPERKLREPVQKIVTDPNRVCFVSSPDVVHAAFVNIIQRNST